jgi:hypothetical protein
MLGSHCGGTTNLVNTVSQACNELDIKDPPGKPNTGDHRHTHEQIMGSMLGVEFVGEV